MRNRAIIRIQCPDQPGIVAKVTDFIHRNNGNVLDLDQHTDAGEKRFFMRVVWDLTDFTIPRDHISTVFQIELATPMKMEWSLDFSDKKLRMAIFVSRSSHCLFDLLARHMEGELDVEIPLIIGNHVDLEQIVQKFDIPFYYFPINKDNKAEQEEKEFKLLEEHGVDFVVLARYMQILSSNFTEKYPNRVINIHHSFLPAFAGAKPYHAAHSRGVKIIGATGHYVTSELDEGPIIFQDVNHITHHDSIESLVQKGKDVEKIVLSRAVKAHVDRKTLVYKNKTIIFN